MSNVCKRVGPSRFMVFKLTKKICIWFAIPFSLVVGCAYASYVLGLIIAILLCALVYAIVFGYFYGYKDSYIEVQGNGMYIKTSDFDDFIEWHDIDSMHVRDFNLYINSKIRHSSIEVPFIEKQDSSYLYKSLFDKNGFKMKT